MQINTIEPLYKHQKEIIDEDRMHTGLWLGTGSSKTRIALEMAEGKTLIIVPKQQVLDRTWEKNAERFGMVLNMTIVSKETFRRDYLKYGKFDTVIIDEAHNFFGALPDTVQENKIAKPKTSQLYKTLLHYLKLHPPKRFYMASATPASKPMNVWAMATLFGYDWDFFRFREKYYIQRKMGYRTIWLPKHTTENKDKLALLVKQMGYTGRLSDWFDVPEQIHETYYVGLTGPQKEALRMVDATEADPMGKRAKKRTIENGCMYDIEIETRGAKTDKITRTARHFDSEKIDYILERAQEFPKMLIFANYIAQIEGIEKTLKKEGYKVYTLTGQTKDRANLISDAEKSEKCIVIAQCGISSGYELKTVDCVIFASKSFRYLDYDQGVGRVLRADALKKNLYIHLVVKGGVDEDCHKTILSGKDFQEKIYD